MDGTEAGAAVMGIPLDVYREQTGRNKDIDKYTSEFCKRLRKSLIKMLKSGDLQGVTVSLCATITIILHGLPLDMKKNILRLCLSTMDTIDEKTKEWQKMQEEDEDG